MWLLYVLAAAGLSVVLVMSKIARPIRNLLPPPIGTRGIPPHNLCEIGPDAKSIPATLLGCCLCTGVWTGFLMGALYFLRSAHSLGFTFTRDDFIMAGVDTLAFGFAGAIVSYCVFAYLCYVKAP